MKKVPPGRVVIPRRWRYCDEVVYFETRCAHRARQNCRKRNLRFSRFDYPMLVTGIRTTIFTTPGHSAGLMGDIVNMRNAGSVVVLWITVMRMGEWRLNKRQEQARDYPRMKSRPHAFILVDTLR